MAFVMQHITANGNSGMHLTLINPSFTFFRKSDVTFSQCMGLLYIGTYVKSNGHDVTLIDALKEGIHNRSFNSQGLIRIGLNIPEILNKIPSSTNMIGISIPFSHLAVEAHELIVAVKERYPETPVIIGGVYPSTQPDLAVTSKADYIVLGEGEIPTLGLLKYISNNKEGELPPGVVATDKSELLEKVTAYYHKNLDEIPSPDRSLLPYSEYINRSQRNLRGWKVASIITSRGCPFDCEFCSVHPVCGYLWRPHSAKRVLEEIDELVDRYGVNSLEIEDDNFTLKRDRAIEILEGIVERNSKGKNICWQAFNGIRIDTLNEEIISLIKKSNCRHINLALEHGDEEVLKIMRKKLSLTKILEVVGNLYKCGITCSFFVIYCYPGESRQNFDNAVKYYKKLKKIAPKYEFQFLIPQPYPGTKLFRRCVDEGWMSGDMFSKIEDMRRFSAEETIWIETPDFDKNEILRRRSLLLKTFSPSLYYRSKIKDLLPDSLVDSLLPVYHIGKRIKEKIS